MNNGIELKNRIKKQIESIRNNSDIYELFKNLNYPKLLRAKARRVITRIKN